MAPRLQLPPRPVDMVDVVLPWAPEWLKDVTRAVVIRRQRQREAATAASIAAPGEGVAR